MKNNLDKTKLLTMNLTLALMVSLMFVTQGCFVLDLNNGTDFLNGGSSSGSNDDPNAVNPVEFTQATSDHLAIYNNMVSTTGIDRGTCVREYEDSKASLPAFNDIKTVGSAAQATLIKLAGCVCDAAIRNNQNGARDRLVQGVDFNTSGNNLSSTEKQSLIDSMTKNIWGEGLSTLPDKKATDSVLTSEIGAVLNASTNGGNSTSTREIAQAVCVSVLGSLPTIVF